MQLTKKELEIMSILWDSKIPMTATEIVEASDNRTWKKGSIFTIINTLIKKGAVVLAHHKPTSTINVRSYRPAITAEEGFLLSMLDWGQSAGVRFDKDVLIESIMKMEGY
jgi:predicted transcriptional regulator